jgi:CysZ protein
MALLAVAASLNCCGMIDAAIKALSQMFAPTLRHVLLKAAGLALVLITFLGIVMQRFLASWAEMGANYGRAVSDAGGNRICRQLLC